MSSIREYETAFGLAVLKYGMYGKPVIVPDKLYDKVKKIAKDNGIDNPMIIKNPRYPEGGIWK